MKRNHVLALASAAAALAVIGACGGSGRNPVIPGPINRPPTVVRIEVVGYAVVGVNVEVPVRAEVQDPDGDTVTCRWSVTAGRVTADASSSCTGTYLAPAAGTSDRIEATPTDSRGAVGSVGSFTIPLGPDSIAIGGPSPNPTPTPPPGPPPSPTPTPPAANGAPTVGMTGGGSCHPTCTRTFTANASDPDGDPLSYSWSGACSGSSSTASVNVTALQTYTCTVTVSDGRGGTASASGTATGTNQAPSLNYDATNTFPANWSGDLPVGIGDDDPANSGTCRFDDVSGAQAHSCTFNGAAQMLINVTLGPAGTNNVIDFTFVDRWGASASGGFRIRTE